LVQRDCQTGLKRVREQRGYTHTKPVILLH
jgi:hypothetical protein